MSISFERVEREATFNDPREDFDTVSIPVKHRFDPLTNRSSRLVTSAVPPYERPFDIDSYVTDDTNCVFCPDMVSTVTPTFVDDDAGKRDGFGEAVCFPNITPYAEESLVVVLTKAHHRAIDKLTSDLLFDGMRTAWNALEGTSPGDGEEAYRSINMNFYPSSGSSIVHPHMHGIADDVGTSEYRRFIERSRAFRNEHGYPYWETLVETEREMGERYIAGGESIDWISAFAPKHFDHVFGVADSDALSDPTVFFEEVAEGIDNILAHYAEQDFNAYNFAIYLPDDAHQMPPIVQILARTPFDKYQSSGVFFMQMLHDEGIIETPPEAYADTIASYF
jgi:galactose-1-phosphate uridylyltransferase